MRLNRFSAIPLLLIPLTLFAKDKTRVLPEYVLNAHTVAVVIYPGAPEAFASDFSNRAAQEAVERELSKWGRYRPVLEATTADLVIAIRRGVQKQGEPTVGGRGVYDRPVVLQPGDTSIRIGAQTGRSPVTSRTEMPEERPAIRSEIGFPDDLFEVFQGNQEYPLDGIPVFRFSGKDVLKTPNVMAVKEFRKAVEESAKQINEKKQGKKP